MFEIIWTQYDHSHQILSVSKYLIYIIPISFKGDINWDSLVFFGGGGGLHVNVMDLVNGFVSL